MIYTTKMKNLLLKARDMNGMSMTDYYAEIDKLTPKAVSLVKDRIHGERKGLPGELNYSHSLRVQEIVSKLHHWDDPDMEMFIAALLHDIVEDGNTTFEELVEMGFSRKTIELIDLCTHNNGIENKTERWTLMIARLIEAQNEEAWCIKLIDLADNLTQSKGLSEENRKFMIEVKAPMMLRLTEGLNNRYVRPYRNYLEKTLEKVLKEKIMNNTSEEENDENGLYLDREELKTRHIVYTACQDEDNCGFIVEFKYPNCTFFYCNEHQTGFNLDLDEVNDAGVNCKQHGKMERYDLLREDNVCPKCEKQTMAILSVPH